MNLDGNQLRHAKERPVKVGRGGYVELLGFMWLLGGWAPRTWIRG